MENSNYVVTGDPNTIDEDIEVTIETSDNNITFQELGYSKLPSYIIHDCLYSKDIFDIDEINNLDYTIARFVLPRLEYLRDNTTIKPEHTVEDMDDWRDALGEIIRAFSLICEDKEEYSKDEMYEIKHGLRLFYIYYLDLKLN